MGTQLCRTFQHDLPLATHPDPLGRGDRDLRVPHEETGLDRLRRQYGHHAQFGLSLRPGHVEDHAAG